MRLEGADWLVSEAQTPASTVENQVNYKACCVHSNLFENMNKCIYIIILLSCSLFKNFYCMFNAIQIVLSLSFFLYIPHMQRGESNMSKGKHREVNGRKMRQ